MSAPDAPRLIEGDLFPCEFLSALAERESWRKEIYRPIYHIHKWWAIRLGTVFRGLLLGCILPQGADLERAFYEKHDFSGVSVLDPFMGSGTTIGEAHKIGCTALGRDINPVACQGVLVALGPLDRAQLLRAFHLLASTVGRRILSLYQSEDDQGRKCAVLYYFWVKQVPCPYCAATVDLFTNRVIARNACPDRKPEVQICCPGCGQIQSGLNGDKRVRCGRCHLDFDPHIGSASGASATCPACARRFSIIAAVQATGHPPAHRLYAKLLLTPEGEKRYSPATPQDSDAYRQCSALLQQELESGSVRLPTAALADGHNTRQAIGYNYRYWRDFFNDRQLLALGWLQGAVADIPDGPTRQALLTLFSGILEFNNLFASYKGEGTGAVRHMFAHHILKPERTPIEANVWGTPKSSGSFCSLFETRLRRALDYRQAPFEVALHGSGKAHHTSAPFAGEAATQWPTEGAFRPRGIYLSCGSSDETGLPDGSVDLVVTDPPFFDNVHYSELADFFYAWQTLYPHGFINRSATTRHPREVQDTAATSFAGKLQAVFAECRRVLRAGGLLVFTYHHSRAEGWTSLVEAVAGAGFSVVNAHPVKAEMSVATPKSQAKEPIQLDVVLVCKKIEEDRRPALDPTEALDHAMERASEKIKRLSSIGLSLSRNDRRIALVSQLISALGPVAAEVAIRALCDLQPALEKAADDVANSTIAAASAGATQPSRPKQMSFWVG